jgi:hypothetical protein
MATIFDKLPKDVWETLEQKARQDALGQNRSQFECEHVWIQLKTSRCELQVVPRHLPVARGIR